MKFNFIRAPAAPCPAFPERTSWLYPMIPIGLYHKEIRENFIELRALIDSGANVNLFPRGFGEAIGLKIENELVHPILGIAYVPIITFKLV